MIGRQDPSRVSASDPSYTISRTMTRIQHRQSIARNNPPACHPSSTVRSCTPHPPRRRPVPSIAANLWQLNFLAACTPLLYPHVCSKSRNSTPPTSPLKGSPLPRPPRLLHYRCGRRAQFRAHVAHLHPHRRGTCAFRVVCAAITQPPPPASRAPIGNSLRYNSSAARI